MHTNTGRQTRQKLREPLQRAQRLYFFFLVIIAFAKKQCPERSAQLQMVTITCFSHICIMRAYTY